MLDFSHVRLQAPVLDSLRARVTASIVPRSIVETFDRRQVKALHFPDRDLAQVIEDRLRFPDPLADLETQQEDAQETLELVRPLLEPSVLSDEREMSVLPGELRPYQRLAVRALMEREVLLLADDPGLGKTVAGCVALAALVQQGEARRSLVICPWGALQHWMRHLQVWAPGLMVAPVWGDPGERSSFWEKPAHIYLTTYKTLVEDVQQEGFPTESMRFNTVLLDGVQSARLAEGELSQVLGLFSAERRWALAGAAPQAQEGWLSVFNFLTPEKTAGRADDTLPVLRKQFAPHVLRRKKAEVADELPRRTRQVIWLDLDDRQAKAYEEVLAEERYRLMKLGGAVTYTHVAAAVNRLKQVSNFAPDFYDGAKVRALVDLVEEIAASGNKLIVFSQFKEQGLDSLQPVLEAYGALRLDANESEDRRKEVLQAFREEGQWHVLLTQVALRTEGVNMADATYIAHFDHSWNPAERRRAEQRIHPSIAQVGPLNVYEFWVADTIDAKIFPILKSRGLLLGQIPPEGRTGSEDHISLDTWLREVLEVPTGEEAKSVEAPATLGTGALPGTAALVERLDELAPETLSKRVTQLMEALGFPEVEEVEPLDETGGDLLARRAVEEALEQVLVRVIRSEKNVGVGLGRELLEDMHARGDCQAAYMISTTDFTSACKDLAQESQGELALISGGELGRHLHILGQI